MIRNISIYILIVTIIFGCKSSVTNNLISEATKKCESHANPKCAIDLKNFTKFEWDKMYLFEAWTISDSIAQIIGYKYDGDDVKDDYSRMLFTYNNKVVYEEDFKSLDFNNSTISFETESNDILYTGIHYLTPAKAVFIVKKGKIENSCKKCFFYTFIPIAK